MTGPEDCVSIPRSLINKAVVAVTFFLVSAASAGVGVVGHRVFTPPPVVPTPAPDPVVPAPVRPFLAKCPHCGGPLLITPSATGQTGHVTGATR